MNDFPQDPQDSEHDAEAIVDSFLLRYLEDSQRGDVRPLEVYQRAFPGFEATIAREYRRLSGAVRGVDRDGGDDDDTRFDAELERRDERSRLDAVDGYRLERVLGQGGMGTVWLAEQIEPIRRQVALKVIKLGMDTSEVIARFRNERQLLASLEHPNLARVYDAGVTRSGRPYFAMEHVAGAPLTSYCDRHRLDIRARLDLFLDVCAGVQFAHQRGVIHRDLKPSNLLVAGEPRTPIVKVIDFGIAKTLSQSVAESGDTRCETAFETVAADSERTSSDMSFVITGLGQALGTPSYMSPEQALRGGFDVDTRADVYSLGVILYELLTGSLPIRFEGRGIEGVEELLGSIESSCIESPSLRLSRHDSSSSRSAKKRATTVPRIVKELRGDLDWITMRAIAGDREWRYSSVSELMADIRRHFTDEPVLAAPPSATYRLRKLLRRHRFGVATSVVLLVAALVTATVAIELTESGHRRQRVASFATFRDEGVEHEQAYRSLKARLPSLRDAWRATVAKHEDWEPAHVRTDEFRAWDEWKAAEARIDVLFNRAVRAYDHALEIDVPAIDRQPVTAALTALYADRALAARFGEQSALGSEFFIGLIEGLGVPDARALVGGVQRIRIRCDPPSASVWCFRYEELEGRLAPLPFDPRRGLDDPRLGIVERPSLRVESIESIESIEDRALEPLPLAVGERLIAANGEALRSIGDLVRVIESTDIGASIDLSVGDAALHSRPALEQRRWVPVPGPSSGTARRPDGRLVGSTRELFGVAFAAYPLALRAENRLKPAAEDGALELTLPTGSYLLVARADGRVDARLPILVPLLPGQRAEIRIDLVGEGDTPPDFVRIPAGVFACGGDDEADASLDRSYPHVDEFFIARHEVTVADYLEFVNDAAVNSRIDEDGYAPALANWTTIRCGDATLADFAPRGADGEPDRSVRLIPAQRDALLFERLADGAWRRDPEKLRSDDWPVLGISILAGVEYARWRTERDEDGFVYRLPTDLEWEKAARGGDLRSYVWGDYAVYAFCKSKRGTRGRASRPDRVGAFPVDESVWGVRDLAGSISEPVLGRREKGRRFLPLRGGNWWAVDGYFHRIANRNGVLPESASIDCGLRLVAIRREVSAAADDP